MAVRLLHPRLELTEQMSQSCTRKSHVRWVSRAPFERFFLWTDVAEGQVAMATSVYRVGDSLIDAGSPLTAEVLVEALADRPPKRILLTHQHEDHVGGVPNLRRRFGAIDVYAAAPHIPILARGDSVAPYRASYWGRPEPIGDLLSYSDGDTFECDGFVLTAVSTPGHTPGHLAIHAERAGQHWASTGDLLVQPKPTAAFFEAAADDWIDSCRRLAKINPGLVVLPTHGKVRKDGAAALKSVGDWVELQSQRIRQTNADQSFDTFKDLAQFLYGPDDPNAVLSGGEFSATCFVRSVLEPVRSLPAQIPL